MIHVAALSRPRLAFGQIWNMGFGFLGIQTGFAPQNANVGRIFQTLGTTSILSMPYAIRSVALPAALSPLWVVGPAEQSAGG